MSPGVSPGVSLSSTVESWTSLLLRQPLPEPLPRGQLAVQAWVRSARGTMPAVQVGVRLEFEDASGGHVEGCDRTRDEMPSETTWTLLATQCAVPAAAVRGRVVFEWACVRSEATLLLDDVSVQPAAEAAAPSLVEASDAPATLPGEQVPRRMHLIFGLAADFGGKPFGLIHHLVIKAAVPQLVEGAAHLAWAPQRGSFVGTDLLDRKVRDVLHDKVVVAGLWR